MALIAVTGISCKGGLGKLAIGETRGVQIQKVRLMSVDGVVELEMGNKSKKKLTFESCRIELFREGQKIAVVDLLDEVRLEPDSWQLVGVPLRVRISGNFKGWTELVRKEDKKVKMDVKIVTRQEDGKNKIKSTKIHIKRTIDLTDLKHYIS